MRITHLSCLAVFTLLAATVHSQTIAISPANRTIALTALDERSAPADIARITVGFRLYAPSTSAANQLAADRAHTILDALHTLNIPDSAIESQRQSLVPNEAFLPSESAEERAQKQYLFQQSWTVTVRADTAGKVVSTAITAGANESGNILWDLSTRDDLVTQAADAALAKARKLAQNMANSLGVKLGPLLHVTNQTPLGSAAASESAPATYGFAGMVLRDSVAQPIDIHTRTIHESVTVYAVFAIY